MKRIFLCATAALVIAATPAMAGKGGNNGGNNGHSNQGVNVNVSVKGSVLGTVLGTVKGQNGLKVNANVTTGKGGLLSTILGGR